MRHNEFKGFLGLSLALSKAEFKLRNEGSYLGVLWYLLNPLLMFGLLFFVFGDRLGGDIEYYSLYLLLGIIMFNFFQNTTLEVTSLIRNYSGIIKSINFRKESLIGATILRNLYSHLFEILFFVVVFFIVKGFSFSLFYYFFVIILFFIFIYGLSLFFSVLSVYFVDFNNVFSFVVRLLWLATPIFYEIAGQTRLFYFNLLNPLYYFLTTARELVIYNKLPQFWLIEIAFIYSILFLILGILFFNKYKDKMEEMI